MGCSICHQFSGLFARKIPTSFRVHRINFQNNLVKYLFLFFFSPSPFKYEKKKFVLNVRDLISQQPFIGQKEIENTIWMWLVFLRLLQCSVWKEFFKSLNVLFPDYFHSLCFHVQHLRVVPVIPLFNEFVWVDNNAFGNQFIC